MNKKQLLQVWMEPQDYQEAKEHAWQERLSLSEWVRRRIKGDPIANQVVAERMAEKIANPKTDEIIRNVPGLMRASDLVSAETTVEPQTEPSVPKQKPSERLMELERQRDCPHGELATDEDTGITKCSDCEAQVDPE